MSLKYRDIFSILQLFIYYILLLFSFDCILNQATIEVIIGKMAWNTTMLVSLDLFSYILFFIFSFRLFLSLLFIFIN